LVTAPTSRSSLPELDLVTQVPSSPVPERAVTVPANAEVSTLAEPALPAIPDAAQSTATDIASVETKPAEEPAFIEVWRPTGRSERRPHRPRRSHRPQPKTNAQQDVSPEASLASKPVEGAATPPPDAAYPSRGPRHSPDERGDRPDREKRHDRH